MSTSSTKFAYKQLPKFEPTYYRQWARTVKDAFGERQWLGYLDPSLITKTDASPTTQTPRELESPVFTPDPLIAASAKAFLTQSIEFKYQTAIDRCETAADIWSVLLERYGTRTRDDELRLESELMTLTKLPTDTIDDFLMKFDDLISKIRAQQTHDTWDNAKLNMHFLRALEMSKVPNEDWKAFATYIGSSYDTISNNQLQSKFRTYYQAHIAPYKTNAPTQEYAYAASTPSTNHASQPNNASPSKPNPSGRRTRTW